MLNMTCNEFLDKLGSSEAVPGGGSTSALVGALGMALGTMVGELTTGKKTYAVYEEELAELIPLSRELTSRLRDAVNRDVTAFEPLAAAYKMPNSTEAEMAARKAAIQEGIAEAALAPLELAELCLEALKVLDRFSQIGSRLAISDAGTGAALCGAAIRGARLNVLINLKSMEDEALRESLSRRLDRATEEGRKMEEVVYSRVEEACRR